MANNSGGYYASSQNVHRAVLARSIWNAAPVQELTPRQRFFYEQAAGRSGYPADPTVGATAPVHHRRVSPDGTVDTVALVPFGNVYIDLGGQGGIDVAAGR